MIEFSKLKELSLNQILRLSDDYKYKAIRILIERIAEDRVDSAISHFETDEESKKFREYIRK